MLIYHPAYDTYHCMVRILKILNFLSEKQFELDRIRIYDYFFLFPNEIEIATLALDYGKYKKILLNNKYNKVQNSKQTFYRLESYQNLAFKALSTFNLIDKYALDNDFVIRTSAIIPEGLLNNLDSIESSYLELVQSYFEELSLKELKRRTTLIEYRYELS